MYDDATTGDRNTLVNCSFDPATTDPVDAVFRVLAETDQVDLTSTEPLASVVDPDALDSLFKPKHGHDDVHVCFQYEGLEVELTSGGTIQVHEAPEEQVPDGGPAFGAGPDVAEGLPDSGVDSVGGEFADDDGGSVRE